MNAATYPYGLSVLAKGSVTTTVPRLKTFTYNFNAVISGVMVQGESTGTTAVTVYQGSSNGVWVMASNTAFVHEQDNIEGGVFVRAPWHVKGSGHLAFMVYGYKT